MAYMALYRKWRPGGFSELVGQEHVSRTLSNAIKTGRIGHAYLFAGPRGTGKTSSAKIFAKALNCENPVNGSPCNQCASCLEFKDSPDIIEIDAASNNGVEEIRELINNVKLVPSNSKYKIYISALTSMNIDAHNRIPTTDGRLIRRIGNGIHRFCFPSLVAFGKIHTGKTDKLIRCRSMVLHGI